MSKTIYLYGRGATSGSKRLVDGCYLKCEIPETDAYISGFFPSVLHAYIMYAKDIGLLVTDVIHEGFDSEEDIRLLERQLPYSLWPLFYVDNSEAFTGTGAKGVAIWDKAGVEQQTVKYETSIMLDTHLAYYYRAKDESPSAPPSLDIAEPSANPIPAPNNAVVAARRWFLDLTVPDESGKLAEASTYSIVKHYNEEVVWNTLRNMSHNALAVRPVKYAGMRGATGRVLKNVVDRRYAYDALVPEWSAAWGEDKPDWYDNMRVAMNNYNISASLFWYLGGDPDSPKTGLYLLATADNIKGLIKAGHAETRLLLTLDALNNVEKDEGNVWLAAVCGFFDFGESQIDFNSIENKLKNKLVLISSLKPCYLCVGEVDSTTDGYILTIDGKPVNMWAAFVGNRIYEKLDRVVYFDIDRPIGYPSTIDVVVHIAGQLDYEWTLALAPWNEWTAALGEALGGDYNEPIGPRIVEPAGECLKTGYAYVRYQNSAYALLTDGDRYLEEYRRLTSNVAYDSESEEDF